MGWGNKRGWGSSGGGSRSKVYGVAHDKANPSPTLTRLDDAVGMVAIVDGRNDFMLADIFGEIREVVDLFNNRYVRIPKHWIKKTDTALTRTWRISRSRMPGSYLPACFYDFTNNKELDYVDIGKHVASLAVDNKLESKTGKYPLINKTIVEFRALAALLGPGYQIEDIHTTDMLQTLFYVMFATLNSQSIMQGYTTGQWSATHRSTVVKLATNEFVCANATADQYRVGQAITCGASEGSTSIFYGRTITAINVVDGTTKAIVFDGAPVDIPLNSAIINSGYKTGWSSELKTGWAVANDGKSPMAFLGIESLWGDVWRFIDGININDGIPWVCKNSAQYMSNLFAAPYEQLSYSTSLIEGYAKTMGHDFDKPFASITSEVGGGASSSAYYSDYYYRAAGQRVALLGGDWSYGSVAGLSFWYLGLSAASAVVYVGARLVKKALS